MAANVLKEMNEGRILFLFLFLPQAFKINAFIAAVRLFLVYFVYSLQTTYTVHSLAKVSAAYFVSD